MSCSQDKMEQIVPSPEEEEEKVLDQSMVEKEHESVSDGEDQEEDIGDGTDENVESESPSAERKIPTPVADEVKKEEGVLNLNNEVVRMRKEVKRLRALSIRKLTRQIAALKKKKGKEAEVERNKRRAARLLEEVHAMKTLSPDLVTKTALQTNLNFEAVCKNPKSTIADRATARIATHPQFQKKITSIKAAVKAFKIERMKTGKQGVKEKRPQQPEKAIPQMPENKGGETCEKKENPAAVIQKKDCEIQDGAELFKSVEDAPVVKKEEAKEIHTNDLEAARKIQVASELNIVRPAVEKNNNASIMTPTKSQAQSTAVKKNASLKMDPAEDQRPADEEDDEESALELSDDEEKEYFDDSTEERFLKQSSQSESEEDDFFLGKVSKYKKKKKKVNVEGTGNADGSVQKGSTDDKQPTDKLQRELDELEARLKSKAKSLQSVFCSSLRGNKTGGGRGRGADKFRGHGKSRGAFSNSRDFSKRSDFQKHEKGIEYNSGFRHKDTSPEFGKKGFASAGKGRGQGRGGPRQKNPRGRGVFTQQAPQGALHPSWEASKKKKEQQGQILAFQGKKIKFDDD